MNVLNNDFIAYLEVDKRRNSVSCEYLYEHSLRTAMVGLVIYENELKGKLRDLFILSALLHDVGKANESVKAQIDYVIRNGGKVSFKCHEVLSAQVVLELKRKSNVFQEVYEPVFYAVLRHHHAMRALGDCKKISLTLIDVGKLKKLIPQLSQLVGIKPEFADIENVTRYLRNKKDAFLLSGFLSLADSVAAFLARRPDHSEKPSKFVRLALEERCLSIETLSKTLEKHNNELLEEIRNVVKKYLG